MNSQPSSVSTRSMVRVGGGAPATTMRTRSRARDRARPRSAAASRTMATTAGAPHSRVTPCCVDAAQDLGAVDLAQHDLGHAHGGGGVRHAPAVAVEHRQRVQVDVAVADAGLPAEGGGVEPQVAVGELHALGPGGGAARVVDGGGGVLVGLVPRLGLDAEAVELVVGRRAELEACASTSMAGERRRPARGRSSSTEAPQCSTM